MTARGALLCAVVVLAVLLLALANAFAVQTFDLMISRSVSWAIVTGGLLAVFAAMVVGLQALLVDVTQGQTLAVAASTLVALALFQPVRRQVQAVVDRRFDRARYDGERTAAAFAARLREETDIGTLTGELHATTRTALAPATLDIWLRGTGR